MQRHTEWSNDQIRAQDIKDYWANCVYVIHFQKIIEQLFQEEEKKSSIYKVQVYL